MSVTRIKKMPKTYWKVSYIKNGKQFTDNQKYTSRRSARVKLQNIENDKNVSLAWLDEFHS